MGALAPLGFLGFRWPLRGPPSWKNYPLSYLVSKDMIDFLRASNFSKVVSQGLLSPRSINLLKIGFMWVKFWLNFVVVALSALSRTTISKGTSWSEVSSPSLSPEFAGLTHVLAHSRITSFCQFGFWADPFWGFCCGSPLSRLLQRPRMTFSMKTALETALACRKKYQYRD